MNVEEERLVEDEDKALSIDRADFETRYSITLAIGKYLRSTERLKDADREFTESTESLRELLPDGSKFIAKVDCNNYLVTMDREGNFDIEQIKTI